VWGYLTGGEEEQQGVGSGSSGSPSRWAHDYLEVIYFPELDHAMVFDARADCAVLLEVLSRFVRQDWASGTSQGTTLHDDGTACNRTARNIFIYALTLSLRLR